MFNKIKQYPKDAMKVALAVLIGFFAVMGWQFSETAKTPFWWNFWIVIAVLCLVAWIVGYVYLSRKQKGK